MKFSKYLQMFYENKELISSMDVFKDEKLDNPGEAFN